MTTNQQTDLAVGRIAGLFGLHGELKCDPSSTGRTVFSRGSQLRCERDSGSQMVTLASVREHKGRLLIRFEGIDSATAATAYSGSTLYAERERLDVGPGEYLDVDLVGCALETESGAPLGTVERVDHFPASDMLVVGGKMVPMVGAFIRAIDMERKRIVVSLPPGLLDDDAATDAL
jgi:16S rRNA processing protein RimM